MKFKVGDRVICKGDYDNKNIVGKVGTVKIVHSECNIGIEFDTDINGHTCSGTCESGHGYFVPEAFLMKLKDNHKIVITTDGIRTLARLYEGDKVIKSTQATCSPDDTFNFDYGAKLAFNRLMDKPEYYSGKVVCVEVTTANAFFTVGKVYEYKNGLIKSDLNMSGDHYYNHYSPVETRAEALGRAGVKFIEYKGENI